MTYILIIVLCAAGILLLLARRQRKPPPPRDTFVCDLCGEKDCICHKEEHP